MKIIDRYSILGLEILILHSAINDEVSYINEAFMSKRFSFYDIWFAIEPQGKLHFECYIRFSKGIVMFAICMLF